jgi:hypothetical protein
MALSNQQKTVLKGVASAIPDFSSTEKNVGEFLSMYFACHILAERLIEYNQKKKKKGGQRRKILNISSIESAIKNFGLTINNTVVENIFSSDSKSNNNHSCRELRNGYVHKFSASARDEINNQFIELQKDMQQWISLF